MNDQRNGTMTNAERQKRYRDRKRGGPPRGRWTGHISVASRAKALSVSRTMIFMARWIAEHAPDVATQIERGELKVGPEYRRLKAERGELKKFDAKSSANWFYLLITWGLEGVSQNQKMIDDLISHQKVEPDMISGAKLVIDTWTKLARRLEDSLPEQPKRGRPRKGK